MPLSNVPGRSPATLLMVGYEVAIYQAYLGLCGSDIREEPLTLQHGVATAHEVVE